jgi:hypothetical protein
VAPVEVDSTRKCGPFIGSGRRFLRNAARKPCMTNRTVLRLINKAHPASVAMIEDNGSTVSGEK